MTRDQFFTRLRRAIARMGVTEVHLAAMLMAVAEQESFHSGEPTLLAVNYFNIAGIKWIEGDEAKGYFKVEFGPNAFERAQGQTGFTAYRGYDSTEHAVQNILWHFRSSDLYRRPLSAFNQTHDYRNWLHDIGMIWDQTNPHHADELVKRYDRWIEILAKEGI